MRATLKIVLPLIISVAAVSLLFAAYQVRREKRMLRNDLSRRAEILGEGLQESVESLPERAQESNLQSLVERFGQREHLIGVAIYNPAGAAVAITSAVARIFRLRPAAAAQAARENAGAGEFLSVDQTLASMMIRMWRFTSTHCRFTAMARSWEQWLSFTTRVISTSRCRAQCVIRCSMLSSKHF
jgi:hypothetical protein